MTIAPYGSWPSPISAADVAGGSLRLDGARFVGDEIWWSEGIPAERGRTALLRTGSDAQTGEAEVLLPAPWSMRSRVHEYGGGAWTADDRGTAYFVEQSDQRVYRFTPGNEPVPLTPAGGGAHGDLTLAEGALWAVRERDSGTAVPARDIVRIPLDGSGADDADAITSVVAGSDFLAYPAPRAGRLAWIAWNHPDMPWDAAELRVGALGADGRVAEQTVVAGGRADGRSISALQPEWTGDHELVFVADIPREGGDARWNLHWVRFDGLTAIGPEPIMPADADTGGPLWNLGARWYGALDDGRIVAVQTNGSDALVVIDPTCGGEDSLVTPLTGDVLVRHVRGERLLLTGAGATVPGGLWLLDVDAHTIVPVRGGVPSGDLDPSWMSVARAMTFPGPNGPVHAFDYPPTNPEVTAPPEERPPYLVLVHGGPTSRVSGTQSLVVSYFTSRGIGVLDVNYGGSSGYGRAYRERLRGAWGVVDVQDTAAAVTGMVEAGLADGARVAIKGGSAGGWTVLCAVADTDVFAAGISRYGVADLRRLAEDTHDFEARYLDGLVGPLPEAEDVYIARSPLSRPETLRTPLLILQGADDPVVPPSQSEALRDALAGNGVPHAYILFEGESHGFRRAETLQRAFEAELAFLGAVLGFSTPGVAPLPLD
ncbi:prolyl oligopeptidase family serine peptidase [Microbacterium sediminis]|uniref:Peptidase S9 n=1 Tax=Microbacterium sediminis TaxID=904291 RepID=A0A1B9NB41_9MICO|nr:prolyl oligopeptidase family serine peptidase [Microbacterium sediminis]OCG73831.1 peptidase S9 [Microbacterium sediminis]QBR74577.1 S9 family peptidase [Microbacterium sediminis]